MQPARFHEGEDIHRANSPLAGPGQWPVEWRVFVRNGRVTGVSNYYGWAGEGPTAENAWRATEAAMLTQRLIDHMQAGGLRGAFMDTVLAREIGAERPDVAIAFEPWDADGFHATIDFIETEQGMMLLEAGPAHAPGGGGHPCAFAGQDMAPKDPARCVAPCEGVAFLPMPHVHLGDPSTWRAGDPTDCILDWPATLELAVAHAPLPEGAERLADAVDTGSPEIAP